MIEVFVKNELNTEQLEILKVWLSSIGIEWYSVELKHNTKQSSDVVIKSGCIFCFLPNPDALVNYTAKKDVYDKLLAFYTLLEKQRKDNMVIEDDPF